MLGVTIAIGNSYRRMAERAAASFAKNAGLKTRILTPKTVPAWSRAQAQMTKLDLFDLVPKEENFIFFDADTLMVRKADLNFGFVDGFGACEIIDTGAVTRECRKYKLDRALYFNSGLMWLDRKQHLEIFRQARALDIPMPRHSDQTYLNIAAQRSGIPITIFDDRHNRMLTCEDEIPDDTVVIHAIACRDPMAGRRWVMDVDF